MPKALRGGFFIYGFAMENVRADKRIGVIVVTGFLGSGKTTLLNRVLTDERMRDTLVIVNEVGEVGVDHHLVRTIDDGLVLREAGCVCCSLRDGFSNTLRDLFMLALQRRIRPFSRVLVETSGLANPAAILFTLQHDPFLAERYVYEGTVAAVDAQRIEDQLGKYPEAAQQVALADLLILSKTQDMDGAARRSVERALACLQPAAAVRDADDGADLAGLFLGLGPYRAGRAPRPGGGWLSGTGMASGPSIHGSVGAFSLQFPKPLRRGAFFAGMAQLQERYGDNLLRVKGLVDFEGEALPCVVHGVHRQLYPLVTLPAWPDDERQTRLVFIARGAGRVALEAEARERLREAVSNGAG